jgi:hypothetical protein
MSQLQKNVSRIYIYIFSNLNFLNISYNADAEMYDVFVSGDGTDGHISKVSFNSFQFRLFTIF